MATPGQTQPNFIVSVEPIKEQIRIVRKKLIDLDKKDPAVRTQAEYELRIIETVWDALGNLTF